MSPGVPYGQGARMLALSELCEWLNIIERHARKLVERGAIPYRKVGHLLRFAETEIEEWSRPQPRRARPRAEAKQPRISAIPMPDPPRGPRRVATRVPGARCCRAGLVRPPANLKLSRYPPRWDHGGTVALRSVGPRDWSL
jgi:excisionase family DNA binding protein